MSLFDTLDFAIAKEGTTDYYNFKVIIERHLNCRQRDNPNLARTNIVRNYPKLYLQPL